SAGSDPGPVAVEVGSRAAAQTVPWTELLAETEAAFAAIRTVTPYRVVRALSIAWVENSLQFAHEVSCEDPLTGLATLAHMRSRLDEVYRVANRDGRNTHESAALVVVELSRDAGTGGLRGSLAVLDIAESMRTVFDGAETIARAGSRRVIALVGRTDQLLRSVASLRTLLEERPGGSDGTPVRLWIEGLPRTSQSASRLLDEL